MSEPRNWFRKHRSAIISIAGGSAIAAVLFFSAFPAYQDRTYRSDIPSPRPEIYLDLRAIETRTHRLMLSEHVFLPNVEESEVFLEWRASMFDRASGDEQSPTMIQFDRQYLFRLELANAESLPVAGSQRFGASPDLVQTLAASALHSKRVQLEAVVLTDPSFLTLDVGETGHKTIDIDLSLMNAEGTRAEEWIGLALGRVEFQLTSGNLSGWTYVSVVLFKDNRALDQVIARYCVSECEGGTPFGRVPGPDTLAALLNDAVPTDAALFLTELQPGHLHGIFVTAKPIKNRRFWVWSTRQSGADFLVDLKTMVGKSFQNFDTPPELLLKRGENLADFVFPPASDAKDARAAFQDFVEGSADATTIARATPSLFVKFDFDAPGEGLLVVPIGLMAVELATGKSDFLGRRVMIEQPLLRPRYSRGDACPSEWVALLPGDTTEPNLKIAQAALDAFRSDWRTATGLAVHNDISDFRNWLRAEKRRVATSLITLSHHDANRLFFFDDQEDIYAANVRSSYQQPSVAILMGCSTGKPGATRFVTSFNDQGVETVIVANFDVHPAVAGAYLGCLSNELSKTKTGMPIEALHFNAINHCPWPTSPPRVSDEETALPLGPDVYIANAMKLSVLGNGKVRVCRVPAAPLSDGVTP
jgi:hypothetical protein